MIKVRRAVAADWQALRETRLRALRESPEAFGSTHEREAAFTEDAWRERISRAVFIARSDGQPVGIATGKPADDPADPAERELVGMWIAPECRGRGVADLLIQAVADWAFADGGTRLTLWVVVGNDRARRAYQRLGFAPTGNQQPVHDDDPSRLEERMALDLRAAVPISAPRASGTGC